MTNTPSLLPCPFCGAPAHGYAIAPHSHSPAVLRLVPELPDHPGSYVIEGQCACGSGLIGANESEVTARWNRRTPQPVVREPLSDAEIAEEIVERGVMDVAWPSQRRLNQFAHAIERAHGITKEGGQHGTE